MLVTDALIDAGRSGSGGWTKEQLALLGVCWPPSKGWRSRVVGTEIPDKDAMAFRGAGREMVAPPVAMAKPIAPTGPLASAYCDGGVIGKNPSDQGGTWAYVLVGPDGMEITRASGVVLASEIGMDVTNNYTELWAAFEMMRALPAGWTGKAITDSFITLCRMRNRKAKMNGIPEKLQKVFRAEVSRVNAGGVTFELVKGHPTRNQLANGIGSKWNVLCDRLCTKQAEDFAMNQWLKKTKDTTANATI